MTFALIGMIGGILFIISGALILGLFIFALMSERPPRPVGDDTVALFGSTADIDLEYQQLIERESP